MTLEDETESSGRAPPWTHEEIALLGTAPDVDIARMLRRTLAAVVRRRYKHKIPEFESGYIPDRWSNDDLKLLGTMPDAELAERLGRTEAAVKQRRRKLHILQFECPCIRWSAEEDAMLGGIA